MVWYNILSYTYSGALTSSGSIFLGARFAYCQSLDGSPSWLDGSPTSPELELPTLTVIVRNIALRAIPIQCADLGYQTGHILNIQCIYGTYPDLLCYLRVRPVCDESSSLMIFHSQDRVHTKHYVEFAHSRSI